MPVADFVVMRRVSTLQQYISLPAKFTHLWQLYDRERAWKWYPWESLFPSAQMEQQPIHSPLSQILLGPSGSRSLKSCKVSPLRKVQLSLYPASTSVYLLVLGRSVSDQWRARESAEQRGVRNEIREAKGRSWMASWAIIKGICFHTESDEKSLQDFE